MKSKSNYIDSIMSGKYTHFILLLSVFLISLCIWTKQITVGAFSWSDAPLHAMDGVFVHDFVDVLIKHKYSLSNPNEIKEWAYQYYAKYPSLGIIVFYPPFFAAIEACIYALMGISVLAARFTVVIFAIAGFWALYFIAKMLFDRASAIFAAGIWASLPTTVIWTQTVMLEVPTVAMILLSCLFYIKFRESNKTIWLILTAIFVIFAFLTKQWAIFISAVFLLDLILHIGFTKTFSRRNIIIALAAGVVIIFYMMFSSRYAALSKMLVRGDNWKHLLLISNWLFYIKALPKVLGIPVSVLSVAGLFIAAATHKLKNFRLFILWAIIFYIFATIIAYKEERYFYLIVPACVLLSAGGVSVGLRDTNLSYIGQIILIALLCLQAVIGWHKSPDRLNKFETAADIVIKNSDTNLVLVDATREGQFIFDMRRLQGADGKIFVLRGSKLLYSRAARKRWKYTEYAKTQKDILNLIKKYSIRYIVVESAPPNVPDWQDYFPPPSQKLRKLLGNRHLFAKVAEFPVSPNVKHKVWRNVKLQVFRFQGRLRHKTGIIVIPVPSMGGNIKIEIANN